MGEACSDGCAVCGVGDCAGVVGEGCGDGELCAKPNEINSTKIAMSDLKMGFLMKRE